MNTLNLNAPKGRFFVFVNILPKLQYIIAKFYDMRANTGGSPDN